MIVCSKQKKPACSGDLPVHSQCSYPRLDTLRTGGQVRKLSVDDMGAYCAIEAALAGANGGLFYKALSK